MTELYDRAHRIKGIKSPMVIVGNKCDLEYDREVQTSDARAFASRVGVPFLEVSGISLVSET